MQTSHRFLAALLLLAYACTGTSILPVMAMITAEVGGSHEVKIRHSAQGTQVLLHHAESDYTPAVSDHVSSLTRLIVRMCRPDAEGDHSLCLREMSGFFFTSTEEAKRDLKSPEFFPIPSVHALMTRQAKALCKEAGRVAWASYRGVCGLESHHLVGTTHLLI